MGYAPGPLFYFWGLCPPNFTFFLGGGVGLPPVIWRDKKLSLHGITLILKSLAIPKILYVCSMSEVAAGFRGEVKKILCKFLWSSTPKTREGFLRKKHSCGFIFFKTVLYTHILNTCLFHK